MNLHEEKFIRAFIVPEKRERYFCLFETKRGRRKLTDRLDHNHDIDSRFMYKIPGNLHFPPSVLAMLRQRGAPATCHVISASDLDGEEMELEDALSATIGYGIGTVLSCIPGKLGYFEAEDQGERYLLYRE